MRVFAAAMTAALAATMAWSSAEAVDVQIDGFPFVCKSPEGEFLKPKFGDVDGIYFTGLPAARKPCLETIDRMIYSCTANTTFISHDLNNQYPDCLATFERQAEQCVRHFEQERQKCDAGDSSAPDQSAAEIVSSSSDDAGDVEIEGFSFGCTTPDGETRKPWYGGVDGTRFTDLPSERESCLSLLSRKISSCRKNVSFVDHRQNRQFAACLPIFKGQVQDCVRHFEQERQKCDAGDSFLPAATTAEPEEPEAEPAHVTMWAAKRSNIRSGPGTDHAKAGLLEVGDEVQVTGEIGDWLRIAAPGGGEAFVWAPLLTEEAPSRPSAATGTGEARALDIPDKATREHVADWEQRCLSLYMDTLDSGVDNELFRNEEKMREALVYWEKHDTTVATMIRDYLETCRPVSLTVLRSDRQCWDRKRKLYRLADRYFDTIRNAELYLGQNSQYNERERRFIGDYMRDCIPIFAAAIENNSLGTKLQDKDEPTEVATPAPAAAQESETTASGSSAVSDTGRVPAEDGGGAARIPVGATHCVKLHEKIAGYNEVCVDKYGGEAGCDGSNRWFFRYAIIDRSYENTCDKPIILRVRNFAKYHSEGRRSYVYDNMFPANYRPDYSSYGNVLEINNTEHSDDKMRAAYPPPSEIAYCAEFVDTDITPEYLYDERYRLRNDSSRFGSYSGVVEHLKGQGIKVGPEMRAYYDAYFDSLEHSPCYAEVVREPPIDYEHFPPLDWYEVSRMSLFVTFHTQGGGFEALSFDEESDFGGVTFHDVGGTDTHYISDLPKPSVGRN